MFQLAIKNLSKLAPFSGGPWDLPHKFHLYLIDIIAGASPCLASNWSSTMADESRDASTIFAKWNVTPRIFEGGEDISLQHFIVPSFLFYLAVYLVHFIACLPAWAKRGMAIRAIENKIDRPTEQKGKGGNNKMLQRNIFRHPIENECRNIPLSTQG